MEAIVERSTNCEPASDRRNHFDNLTLDNSFNLTGTAMITTSPCISSLTFSGQAIGEAFSLTDTANKAHVSAVPLGGNFAFIDNFDLSAASCAGDFGADR
jgi:hypothetical protein